MAMAGPMDPQKNLKQDLSDVPHSLQLDHIVNTKHEKRVSILERIEKEVLHPCGYEEEEIRRNNFLSLLHFSTREKEKALEINSEVREHHPTNITALVNKAVMKMATGNEFESQEAVEELYKLRTRGDYEKLLVAAKAEQAYCMSRIGPHLYVRAIDLYEHAIKECPEQYLWKFGCALTCRRCLGMPKCIKDLTPEMVKEFCERAVRYLSEITSHCMKQPLIAKAYVELGDLYHLLKNPVCPLTQEIANQVKIEGPPLTAEQCLDKALETVNNACLKDEFVLGRCGRLLLYERPYSQYHNTLLECYTLLEKAYAIRPSSFICDNLAKILFKLTEQSSGRGRGRGRGYDRWRSHYGHIQPGSHAGDTEMPYKDHPDRSGYASLNCSIEEPKRQLAAKSSLNAPEFVAEKQASSDQHLMVDSATGDLSLKFAKLSTQIQEFSRDKLQGGRSHQRLSKMLNSPKQLVKYPIDQYLTKAVDFLKESIAMTKGCNHYAMYHLGLHYRRLDQMEAAEEQFRKIIADLSASPFHKSVAYEQLGFCLFEKIEGSQYSDVQKQRFRKEGMMMMRRSIEQASIIVAQSPTMGKDAINSWKSLPTLKRLLKNKPKKLDSAKEVASLCALVGAHSEFMEYYEQLLLVKPGDPSLLSQVIKEYMFSGDFQNARSCLNLLLCTREGRQMVDNEQDLVYQVYLGIAKQLLGSEPSPSSKDTIRSCFQSAFIHRHGCTSGEDDGTWDVFVLDDPEQTDAEADAIQAWFRETCGLSVTRNDDNALGYEIGLTAEINAISKCKCLVVLLGKEAVVTKRLKTLVAVAHQCDNLDVILPVLTCPQKLWLNWSDKRPVELPKDFPTCQPSQHLMNVFLSLVNLDYTKFVWLDETSKTETQ